MKIVIRDTERGLLIRDGRVVEWLSPGRHRRWACGGSLEVERIDLGKPISVYRPELADVAPEEAWREPGVGATEFAVIRVDGLAQALLRPGRYMLWQLRGEVTASVHDLAPLRREVPEADWKWLPGDLVLTVTVAPYERVLVYADGRLAEVLAEGRALVSEVDRVVELVRVGLREEERTIVGQEP